MTQELLFPEEKEGGKSTGPTQNPPRQPKGEDNAPEKNHGQPPAPPTALTNSKADPETLRILAEASIKKTGGKWHAQLHCGTLEREAYEKVNKILEALGGKWKKTAHIFPYDPSDHLAACIQTGFIPEKNPLDYFPTPPEVVEEMICEFPERWFARWPDSPPPFHILEPSAGTGHIIRQLVEKFPKFRGHIDAIESNPLNAAALEHLLNDGTLHTLHKTDFLDWWPQNPDTHPRVVIMNPPFADKTNKRGYQDHIRHAWEIILANPENKPGILISITPTGWLTNTSKQDTEFRNLVALYGYYQSLPPKAFSEAGTNTQTGIVQLNHNPDTDIQSVRTFQIETFATVLDSCQDWQKKQEALGTTKMHRDAATEAFTKLLEEAAAHFAKEPEPTLVATDKENVEIYKTHIKAIYQ